VETVGLKSSRFNGKTGVIVKVEANMSSDRVAVRFDRSELGVKAIKCLNLKVAPAVRIVVVKTSQKEPTDFLIHDQLKKNLQYFYPNVVAT